MSFPRALVVACGAAIVAGTEPLGFDEYCAEYGKSYTGDEYAERRALYGERLAEHERINARPGITWTAGPGPMTDLRVEEMQRFFGYAGSTGVHADDALGTIDVKGRNHTEKLPRAFDWRNHTPNIVPEVRSQGGCGSCWAFSAVATIESDVAKEMGVMLDLSPQQLTSCTPNPRKCGGSGGCSGATAQLAYNYTIRDGITTFDTAPYTSGRTGRTGACKVQYSAIASITGFVQLPANNAPVLLRALVDHGLISISVDASRWFRYRRGIYDDCAKENPIPNHAVTLVGYGELRGLKYWLIQNSWGWRWGEEGYIRLRRYDDEPCGLNTDPQQNSGCEGGPANVTVCGECGMLSDSSYPTGGHIVAAERHRRLSRDFFV